MARKSTARKAPKRKRGARIAKALGTIATVAGAARAIVDEITHPMGAPATGMRRTARGHTARVPMAERFAHRGQ